MLACASSEPYCVHMPQANWSDEVARTIGRQVRRYRDRAGMSAQRLADELAELGAPMERSVLAGLENGRRRTVSVAELIAFGKVLDVAPLALVYPVEDEDPIEVLPGQFADVVAASKWFAGDTPFPDEAEGLTEAQQWAWADDAAALSQLRKHDRYVQLMLTFLAAGRKASAVVPYDPQVSGELNSVADVVARAVRASRDALRARGLTPPPLPPEFVDIDSAAGPRVPPFEVPPTIEDIRSHDLDELRSLTKEMQKAVQIMDGMVEKVARQATERISRPATLSKARESKAREDQDEES